MALITHPKHALARSRRAVDVGRLVAEPIIMSELTVGYGQVVLSLFADLGIRPNIVAVADNIETMKVIVQSGRGICHRATRLRRERGRARGAQSAGDRADAQRDAQPVPPPPAAVAEEGGLSQCRPRGVEGLNAAAGFIASGRNCATTIWTYLLTTRQIYRINGVSSLVRGVF